MAQSVNLWGATYSDVPAIEVPKSGGGMASFTDVTDTTAVASDVAQGKYFFTATGQLTLGTASGGGGGSVTQDQDGYIVLPSTGGGGGGATQHVIHLEFSDSTDTDIDVYYDDAVLGTIITEYQPSTWTYSSKTVVLAQLDNVTWYNKTVSWTTLFSGTANANADSPYNYFWIANLSNVYPTAGSNWRITIDNTEYLCAAITATISNGDMVCVGNPKYSGGTDNGNSAPFNFYNAGWGAWVGDTELASGSHSVKIEQATSV